MLQQVLQTVRGGEYVATKTILGFLGSIAAIVGALALGLAFALAGTDSLHYLIIGMVIFAALVVCVVLGVVIYFAGKDPSKLQLERVSAKDYIAIQSMGDDTYGEYIELPGTTPSRSSDQSPETPKLQPGAEEESK